MEPLDSIPLFYNTQSPVLNFCSSVTIRGTNLSARAARFRLLIKSNFSTRLLNASMRAFPVRFKKVFLPLFQMFRDVGRSGSNFISG